MRFCHIHNGQWEQCTVHEGLKHCFCVHRYDDYEMPNTPLFGVVPGGASPAAAEKAHSRKFDNDLTRAIGSMKAGLTPEQPTAESVREAERDAEFNEKMSKRHG